MRSGASSSVESESYPQRLAIPSIAWRGFLSIAKAVAMRTFLISVCIVWPVRLAKRVSAVLREQPICLTTSSTQIPSVACRRMYSTAAVTFVSVCLKTVVDLRLTTPRMPNVRFSPFAFGSRSCLSSSSPQRKPAFSKSGQMLESVGFVLSQISSLLSMPITAKSSGTRMFSWLHAASTSSAVPSNAARIPHGFGSSLSHLRSDSRRFMPGFASLSKTWHLRPFSFMASQKAFSRSFVQNRGSGNPTKA